MMYFGVNNLFGYCDNNPVMNSDPSGRLIIYNIKFFDRIVNKLIKSGVSKVRKFAINHRLSINLYLLSLTAARFNWIINLNDYPSIIKNMTDRLSSSRKVRSRIKEYVKKAKNGSYAKCEFIMFYDATCYADKDLSLSIGSVDSFTMEVQYVGISKGMKKYKVSIAIIDDYDFDYFEKGEKKEMVSLINNYGGYWPMKWGAIKEYYWHSFSTFYYYGNL